jgi:hypothetical protein
MRHGPMLIGALVGLAGGQISRALGWGTVQTTLTAAAVSFCVAIALYGPWRRP